MSNAVKTRDSALNSIKRYMTKSTNDAFTMDEDTVQSYLQLLKEQWERFNTAQDAVEMSCGDGAKEVEENNRIQGETWYAEALANFSRVQKSRAESQRPSSSTPVAAAIRLPKMDLPTFSGDPTEWISFYDAFTSLIDTNTTLSNGQKLHYLRGCLKGDALKIITGFKVCDANYIEAWELLKARYKVMRVIVEGHLRAMASIKAATHDTADAIKGVVDAFQQHIRELKALGRTVDFWDDWLVHEMVNRLAFETRKQWELSLISDDCPTFEQLTTFLEVRCRSLALLSSSTKSVPVKSKSPSGAKLTNVFHAVHDQSSANCGYCHGPHRLYSCDKFRNLDFNAKSKFVRESRLCTNCLSSGHYKAKCNSSSACRVCHQRHHTLLHNASAAPNTSTTAHLVNNPSAAIPGSITADLSPQANVSTLPYYPPSHPCTQTAGVSSYLNTDLIPPHPRQRVVLLATALVKIQDYSGRWQPARLLFDSGSHASFITEACVQRLKLPRKASAVVVTGIGSSQGGRSRGEVILSLSSYCTDQCFNINALILPKITSELPTQSVAISDWPHVHGLFLADPEFMKPGRIDMLVGMDIMQNFVCSELRKGPSGTPMAQRTVFGWTLFGNIDQVKSNQISLQSLHCDIHLDRALTRIWELEESPVTKHFTSEERHCEELFEATHQRSCDGRFTVELPLKPGVQLGESRSCAVRSLLRIEKKLGQDNYLHKRYNEFMKELLDMGHMELAPDTAKPTYYMPHHPVVKESSLTTKLRVVFNASAKTSSGNSLNDALFIGPQLQQDLFSILTRFRMHRFAVTADVAKMYRQVCVSPKHTDLQRIVWRRDASLPIQDYRMLRVTYGVAAASHLAVKSLQQTAKSSPNANEKAVAAILEDFYMDDLLTGASSKEELILLQRTVSQILQEGGFELRKWASNCAELTESIANSSKAMSHYLVEGEEVHALGLMWNMEEDNLSFTVNLSSTPTVFTKRIFLSDASRLFDPLGLLAPTTIKAKMWLQEIWRNNVGWDEAVPGDIVARWLEHRLELQLLSGLKLNRWLGLGVPGSFTELHVFADASERAYAAVVYARTVRVDGKVSVAIISSKTKVAPVKTTTLPRLELCAAHLSAKLARSVLQSLQGNRYPLYAWTDSTITLAWIQAHPSRWVTFIANRVADIQEVLPPERWNHVRSELNPADCASRGVTPRELLQQQLWWTGPEFLRSNDEFWKATSPQHATEMGLRKKAVLITTPNEHWSLFTKFSSYSKLRRVVAYVLRFCVNARTSARLNATKRVGSPNCSEISEAELRLIRYTQLFYFPNEISLCSAKKPISLSSSLLRLQPYMDEKGVLRVGGRLKNAELTPDAKHPIILPKDSPLSRLIIHDIHLYTLHAGPRIMQTVLQRRYWITGARNLIRNVYHKCVKCTCFNRNIASQTMGNLPQIRTTFARCFTHAAVDFAGPYMYKYTHGRGAKATKGYICSFVCMCTGAMHLEFVSDLSTPAFLNAFKRFINRRGHCKIMSSDNGTNFVGAQKYLRIAYQQCLADNSFREFFADSNIEWRFNPPSAPHMGGYWETGIKRIKYHLKRVIGETLLSYEEFHTLLTEIEACVNSRPLCDNPATAGDFEVLTPGHFIIGEPLKSIPEPEGQGFWGNLGQRWHAISALRHHFWRRWLDEYLVNLQRRAKWFRPSRNLKEGDVVAIYKEPTPPTKWMLGRVIQCHPGSDGRVRVVTLKTPHGGPYASFAGRDASRNLATFNVEPNNKEEYDDLSDLNAMEMDSVREWEMQFKEKYDLVGKLLRKGEQPTNYDDEEEDSNEVVTETITTATASTPSANTNDEGIRKRVANSTEEEAK